MLGLVVAATSGDGGAAASGDIPSGPLPSFDTPPASASEARARFDALRAVRPDARDGLSDWYRQHTWTMYADGGTWLADVGPGQGRIVIGTLDEYGRPVKGVSGNPLGMLLTAAGVALPCVPGLGPAASAALAVAIAYGQGKSTKDALLAGARAAIPGGALAGMGFDIAVAVANGEDVDDAAIAALFAAYPAIKVGYDEGRKLLKG